MTKKIRGQYIKNLVADKEALSEQLKANTKDSLRSLLEDTVKDSLRDILNEEDDKEKDENSFDVEEVDTDNTTDDTTDSEISIEDETSTDTESGDTDTDSEEEIMTDTEETEGDTDNGEVWNGLDDVKVSDNEYDLTGMDTDSAIKVLCTMKPEDGIRVVKNDNGTITLSDDETDKEYVIDLEGELTGNETEEATFELSLNEDNLGYTDNYQNKTAMTTPSNNEPGKNVRTWDKGAPMGTEKPWAGNKGDMTPYDKNVNEANDECNNECGKNCIFELEIGTDDAELEMDEGTSIANGSRTTGKKGDTNHSEEDQQRHVHKSYDRVNEQKLANMIRKAESIMAENAELKQIANELREKVNEAVVINASLAKVVNLVTENSTTRDEKINILKRFNEVKTVNESKKLYETISNELKNAHPVNNGSKLINEQLGESKPKATETQMYKSDDLKETIDFMRRLNNVK